MLNENGQTIDKNMNTNFKKKYENLFYYFILLLGVVTSFLSAWDSHFDGKIQQIYENFMISISAAFFMVFVMFLLKKWFYYDEAVEIYKKNHEEVIIYNKKSTEELTGIRKNSLESIKILREVHKKEHIGSSYINRDDYYKKYYQRLSNSKYPITIIGDGYSCHTEDSNELAIQFCKQLKVSLNNNVKINRFNYCNTLSLKWLEMLIELKDYYKDNFNIYMNSSIDPPILPYVICLIPEENRYWTSIMFTSKTSESSSLGEKLAGPALIFENDRALVKRMLSTTSKYFHHNNLMSATDLKEKYRSIEIEINNKIKKYIDEYEGMLGIDDTFVMKIASDISIYEVDMIRKSLIAKMNNSSSIYFSYGSNMDINRIKKRTPTSQKITIGTLENYNLVFDMIGTKGEGKGGGVANIEKQENSEVYGVAYYINDNESKVLKSLEISMGYSTLEHNIHTKRYGYIKCWMFRRDNSKENHIPNKAYINFIITGMNENKFPEEYISKVKSIGKV